MAILFDLDGTILDTSHDIYFALTQILGEENKPVPAYEEIRPLISFGGMAILSHALKLPANADESDLNYIKQLAPRFIALNLATNYQRTKTFPGINQLLATLDQMQVKWGIVTNRTKDLTETVLTATGLYKRAACVVSGDTTAKAKPHPEPLLHACDLIKIAPQQCMYIGDAENDIIAGRAAGMKTMAVGFGFIPPGISIQNWHADYTANTPEEILPWIQEWSRA